MCLHIEHLSNQLDMSHSLIQTNGHKTKKRLIPVKSFHQLLMLKACPIAMGNVPPVSDRINFKSIEIDVYGVFFKVEIYTMKTVFLR